MRFKIRTIGALYNVFLFVQLSFGIGMCFVCELLFELWLQYEKDVWGFLELSED